MDKSKDNLDDDNKMEKYESNFDYDPQTYCRVCDMNLRGIQHLLKCQNSELVKAKPPSSQVEQDYETFETKEKDNSEKVDKREEKNHETLAEKVSKLENEGEEMNDIVEEVEKAEKLLAIIRDLENRDLSDQDRVTLKFAQEKLIERANQIKDLVKKKEEIVKNETAENELKEEESDKVENEEKNEAETDQEKVEYEEDEINKVVEQAEKNLELIRVRQRRVLSPQDHLALNVAEETLREKINQVKDLIKKREDVVENETKVKEEEEAESDKVNDKEKSEVCVEENNETVGESVEDLIKKREDVVENETKEKEEEEAESDKVDDKDLTPEEPKSAFPRLRLSLIHI